MIKISEVRLGNYIAENQLPHFEITGFRISDGLDLVLKEKDWISLKACSGIFITKEWLKKLEFSNGDSNIWRIAIGQDGYLAYQKQAVTYTGTPVVNVEETWWIATDSVRLKFWKQPVYIHQLQNLYFALAGEELTLKS